MPTTQALKEGLALCQELFEEYPAPEGGSPTIHGSVFVPGKRLLAQMRFRPWNGVFLSEAYLSGVDAAMDCTRQLLTVYAQHGVVPLVESAVRNEAELQALTALLLHYDQACAKT